MHHFIFIINSSDTPPCVQVDIYFCWQRLALVTLFLQMRGSGDSNLPLWYHAMALKSLCWYRDASLYFIINSYNTSHRCCLLLCILILKTHDCVDVSIETMHRTVATNIFVPALLSNIWLSTSADYFVTICFSFWFWL